MTPVGHAAVAYCGAAIAPRRISLVAAVLGGLAPDIDFLLLPFAFFNDAHRVWTHNLLFVGLVALVGLALRRSDGSRAGLGLLLGGLLHLLVDSVLDTNPTNGIGIALLWPLSREMVAPFNLAAALPISASWDRPGAALRGAMTLLAVEVPLYVVVGMHVWWGRRRSGHA